MTATERKSDFKLITDTPYLALTDELWGVNYENVEENWPRYNGTALYLYNARFSAPWTIGWYPNPTITSYGYVSGMTAFMHGSEVVQRSFLHPCWIYCLFKCHITFIKQGIGGIYIYDIYIYIYIRILYIIVVWRRHENMSPSTCSMVIYHYERIYAYCCGIKRLKGNTLREFIKRSFCVIKNNLLQFPRLSNICLEAIPDGSPDYCWITL